MCAIRPSFEEATQEPLYVAPRDHRQRCSAQAHSCASERDAAREEATQASHFSRKAAEPSYRPLRCFIYNYPRPITIQAAPGVCPTMPCRPFLRGCTMPDKWMTIAAAAATLDVHPRTIERRIAAGKVETCRADDGQVQVLVNVPDEPAPASPSPDPAFETVRELAQDQVSLATGSASALVKFAQADAERARGELLLIREEATRARQGARLAWSAVALMAASVCVAVGWTSHRVAQADAQVQSLKTSAAEVERSARQLLSDRDTARQQIEASKIAEANATGRLAAYVEQAKLQSAKRPATQPTNVFQRIAAAITGD